MSGENSRMTDQEILHQFENLTKMLDIQHKAIKSEIKTIEDKMDMHNSHMNERFGDKLENINIQLERNEVRHLEHYKESEANRDRVENLGKEARKVLNDTRKELTKMIDDIKEDVNELDKRVTKEETSHSTKEKVDEKIDRKNSNNIAVIAIVIGLISATIASIITYIVA